MKRRLALGLVSLMAAASLQVVAAPSASACADPNCPWSPITTFVKDKLWWIDRKCDEMYQPGCPL